MNPEFNQAEIDDIPEILDMMHSFYAIDQYPFDREKSENNLKTFVQNPDLGRLWLISADQVTVGYVVLAFGFSLEYGGRDAFIDELFIKDAFRKQGVGSAVMDFLIKQAKDLGVKTLHLEVERHNETGSRLYTRKGFASKNRKLLSRSIE